MPHYRRYYLPGPVFVTIVTHQRRPWLVDVAGEISHAMHATQTKYPFRHLAHVILPDHLHWLFEPKDTNFSVIVAAFKRALTWQAKSKGERLPLWQARFYDHLIRDQNDLRRHLDYIHYNSVRHGCCAQPADWAHSSFSSWLERGAYDTGWGRHPPEYLRDMNVE
jgi:putative transposase